MEVPYLRWHASKILCLVDPDAASFRLISGLRILHLFDDVVPGLRKACYDLPARFHQVQANQPVSELAQFAEEISIRGERQAREVNLEKFGVACTVGWGVEDGVHIVEDVFWPEGVLEVALAIGNEGHSELVRDVGDECWREVG